MIILGRLGKITVVASYPPFIRTTIVVQFSRPLHMSANGTKLTLPIEALINNVPKGIDTISEQYHLRSHNALYAKPLKDISRH